MMTSSQDAESKICFLICPIGEKDSIARKRSNDLLDLVIEPALQVFGFDVVRADKISTASVITNDILELVQQAELCIADLTDHNPNVFYEVGRRHETGKPSVQMIEEGQKLPFDLAGIRTIKYDLSKPRSVKAASDEVQSFVGQFEKSGYSLSSGAASLSTLAERLERIERRLDVTHLDQAGRRSSPTILGGSHNQISGEGSEVAEVLKAMNADPLLAAFAGPKMQIQALILKGDVDGAAEVLSRSRNRLPASVRRTSAGLLTAAGHQVGLSVTLEILEEGLADGSLNAEEMRLGIGSAVHYFFARDEEEQGVVRLAKLFDDLLEKFEGDQPACAFVYNQVAKLHGGAGRLVTAVDYARRATKADPAQVLYAKNLASLEKEAVDQESESS